MIPKYCWYDIYDVVQLLRFFRISLVHNINNICNLLFTIKFEKFEIDLMCGVGDPFMVLQCVKQKNSWLPLIIIENLRIKIQQNLFRVQLKWRDTKWKNFFHLLAVAFNRARGVNVVRLFGHGKYPCCWHCGVDNWRYARRYNSGSVCRRFKLKISSS